jgi:hypothetical protein
MEESGGIFIMNPGMQKCRWKLPKYSGNLSRRLELKFFMVEAFYT